MVKIYVADLKVKEILNTVFDENNLELTNVGLILGQFSASKDYVLHLVRAPFVDGRAATNFSSEKLLTNALLTHSRQVRQLLTGGMDILGLVVFTSSDNFEFSYHHYKQLLYSSYKVIGKFDGVIRVPHTHNDRVLLHICSTTHKLTCRSFDITDPKGLGSPAEWKYQKLSDCFVSISTELLMKRLIYVARDQHDQSLENTLDKGLEQELTEIKEADVLLRGELVEMGDDEKEEDEDGSFIKVKKKEEKKIQNMSMEALKERVGVRGNGDGGGGGSKKGRDAGTDLKVELICNMSKDMQQPLESAQVQRCRARIMVHGMVAGRAFVHRKMTFSQALKALKVDVMRSLLTRCEFVCQDLIQSEEDQSDIQLVYESPIRVFVSLHKAPTDHSVMLQLCDYLFQEEAMADSSKRFSEVLGIPADQSTIVYSCETFPDTTKLESESNMDEVMGGFNNQNRQHCLTASSSSSSSSFSPVIDLFQDRHQATHQSTSYTYTKPILLAGSVVVAAVVVAYFSVMSSLQQLFRSRYQHF